MRPNHIEHYLASLHQGQWFGFSDPDNKIYANLIIHDSQYAKPTEEECNTGLSNLQTAYDDAITNRTSRLSSVKTKLIALGFTEDEIREAFGI